MKVMKNLVQKKQKDGEEMSSKLKVKEA